MTVTRDDLIEFEREVAELFNAGRIRAPVHLAGGNEDQLIKIFADIRPNDWIAVTWRSHYHCLLKGVPRERLLRDIVDGKRSIALAYPEYRIIASAIVGGHLPIALGTAWAIKRARGSVYDYGSIVWAFLGDMAGRGGMFFETWQYAVGHDLPIRFVIENNELSVCTPTEEAWGGFRYCFPENLTMGYRYALPWPHSGAGQRVNF